MLTLDGDCLGFQSMVQVAGDSIPRVAENVGLAMGAFCMVSHLALRSVPLGNPLFVK